jgi:hypothetical protein
MTLMSIAGRPPYAFSARYTDARLMPRSRAIAAGLVPAAFSSLTFAVSTLTLRPLYTPAAFAFAIPSMWITSNVGRFRLLRCACA